ncbi:hypothetical protein BP00DRAFT_442864 [Aspergillus indologenus CBS 114.80]|uniref:Uncharacterized protein n=1 Tax=Aspergillus indologenus CBS 114.80 TaxID=1450541 RepID=A0A2V5IGU5_9EURO|nr:hypothetical protein BP00DRAFT_442864 [Aspergillus indologenus CBS 114.80]
MPHQLEPGHALVAPLDLEGRKTCEERARESAAILKHPRYAEMIRQRGCKNKSLYLVEEVARYLHAHGMTYFGVCCAYWRGARRWKMLVVFRRTDLPAAAREAARGEILARFLGPETPLEVDQALESREEVWDMERAIAHWRWGESDFRTRLLMWGGRARVVERDGEVLLRRLDKEIIESPESSATGPMPKWLRTFLPARRKKTPGLPLEVAFAKMRLPSEHKYLESDMLAFGVPVRFILKLESRGRR